MEVSQPESLAGLQQLQGALFEPLRTFMLPCLSCSALGFLRAACRSLQQLVDHDTAGVWAQATQSLLPAGMLPPDEAGSSGLSAQSALRAVQTHAWALAELRPFEVGARGSVFCHTPLRNAGRLRSIEWGPCNPVTLSSAHFGVTIAYDYASLHEPKYIVNAANAHILDEQPHQAAPSMKRPSPDAFADLAAFTAFEHQLNRELASSCDIIPTSSLAHHCIWLPDGLRIVLITANLQGTPLEHGSHLRLIRLRDGCVELERFLHGNLRRIGGSKYMHPILVWALSDRRLGLLDASSLCFRVVMDTKALPLWHGPMWNAASVHVGWSPDGMLFATVTTFASGPSEEVSGKRPLHIFRASDGFCVFSFDGPYIDTVKWAPAGPPCLAVLALYGDDDSVIDNQYRDLIFVDVPAMLVCKPSATAHIQQPHITWTQSESAAPLQDPPLVNESSALPSASAHSIYTSSPELTASIFGHTAIPVPAGRPSWHAFGTPGMGIRRHGLMGTLYEFAWSPNGRAVVSMDQDCTFGDVIAARASQPHVLSTCQARLTGRDRGWGWPQWAADGSSVFQPSNGYIVSHPAVATPPCQPGRAPHAAHQAAIDRIGLSASEAAAGVLPGLTDGAKSLPHFITCGASLSPNGAVLVDLVGNDLLAPGLKPASSPRHGLLEEQTQLDRHQASLYHFEVESGEVHIIVPDLKRRTGSSLPLTVAWHPCKWPATQLIYACTDFRGAVMWVDARQHQLLGRWEKSTLLQPILRPEHASSASISPAHDGGTIMTDMDHDYQGSPSAQESEELSHPQQQAASENPDQAVAAKRLQVFEADGDWSELVWSTDGLQLACLGHACLAVIAIKSRGRAGSGLIRA